MTLRTTTLILTALTVVSLTACGNDTADQTADAAPAAAAPAATAPSATAPSATATPTAEPTTSEPTTSEPTPRAPRVPGFLAGTDLPPHPTSAWFAGKITSGMPEFGPFCVEDALKTQRTIWHRQFGTEFDTNASQVVVRLDSEEDAEAFMDVLNHGAALCAEDWLQGFPEGASDAEDYGAPSATTHVYGVHTSVPESEDGAHLYGIGRDGVHVTVVAWSQMGNLSDAPVQAFTEAIIAAVEKLA